MSRKEYTVAVAGATGAVGDLMIRVLEERDFPVGEIRYLASSRSVGKVLKWKGEDVPVQELTKDAFGGVDIALFSAGGGRSKEFAPAAVDAGAVVVDNSSAFRMDTVVLPEPGPPEIIIFAGLTPAPSTYNQSKAANSDNYVWFEVLDDFQ